MRPHYTRQMSLFIFLVKVIQNFLQLPKVLLHLQNQKTKGKFPEVDKNFRKNNIYGDVINLGFFRGLCHRQPLQFRCVYLQTVFYDCLNSGGFHNS